MGGQFELCGCTICECKVQDLKAMCVYVGFFALEVPVKQERGGGGLICHFRGAAALGGTDCLSWP